LNAASGTRISSRPLRRDAASNRRRILEAAATVFVEEGLDGSVEEVARLAGVGVGTLYRHFPTKEALVHELVTHLLTEVIEVIDAADSEPGGEGLERCVWQIAELQAAHRGCQLRLWRREVGDAHAALVEEARAGISVLLNRAKAAHRVREDVTREDVSLVLTTIGALIELTVSTTPNVWRRSLEIMLLGLGLQ
jgi:AcrR family transcriptional regulator